MCDYSLVEFSSRLAVDGEVLMVHRFRSGSLGLASPADCRQLEATRGEKRTFWSTLRDFLQWTEEPQIPAVCIPPGARLRLHDIPACLRKELGVAADEAVTFVQTSAAVNCHRDAVRFRTGRTLHLQELMEGQRVEVVDLGHEASGQRSSGSLGSIEIATVLGGAHRR